MMIIRFISSRSGLRSCGMLLCNTRKHVSAAIRASVVYRANIVSNGCLVSSTFKKGFILTRRVIKQGGRVGENLHETHRIALGSNRAGRGRVTHRGVLLRPQAA